jgi:hypothetical protein
MTTNTVLDVGLGLITMYLMLSLACTVVNEYLASILALRSKMLAAELPKLIDDTQLRATFEQHGLISTQHAAGGGQASYLTSASVAKALLDSLDPAKPVVAVSDVIEAAQKLPESNVKDAIVLAATSAGADIDKLRRDVAIWFDNAMDRLNGVYRRKMQWFSFLIGLALVVVLNADSVNVATALWRDGTLRGEIISISEKVQSQAADQVAQGMHALTTLESDVRPFPLGWFGAHALPRDALGILSKILGLLITALSISLGAPFWFDLLSKFVDIRAAGTKPKPMAASAA